MRLMFMGTPEFARVSLEALFEAGFEVAAAVSQPDKPQGRKRLLLPTPVKEFALSKGVEVYQPATLKDGSFKETLERVAPELIVVVAYGKILPQYVLDYPKYGCINLHGSLLPKYRGAAPIQWAIANGEKVTGVTTMYMNAELDAGDMILKDETEIGPDETAGQLYNRLADIGARLLIKTVKLIESGNVAATPQDPREATYAPVITREHARIDWSKPANDIRNLVRAMVPWPVCYTSTPLGELKVYGCKVVEAANGSPGEVLGYTPGLGLLVKAKDGALALYDIQLQGKKRMGIDHFMRGHAFEKGIRFE